MGVGTGWEGLMQEDKLNVQAREKLTLEGSLKIEWRE